MPILDRNGIELYYEVHGPSAETAERPPLMLVAGLASDSLSWATVLPVLAERRRVVVFDNRGCGRTAPQDFQCSIELMADDCVAIADRLGMDRFDLLGHSMGGCIALDCALRHPERVTRLVLANTGASTSARNDRLFDDWRKSLADGLTPDLWIRNFFYWIFTPAFFKDPSSADELLRLTLEYPYPQSPDGFGAQATALKGFDRRSSLSDVEAETLVLCSGADMLFPPGEDGAGLDAVPTVRVVVVPDQAHALHVEAPQDFLLPVLDFLD